MSIQEVHTVLKTDAQTNDIYVFADLGHARAFEEACRASGEECVVSSEPVLSAESAANIIKEAEGDDLIVEGYVFRGTEHEMRVSLGDQSIVLAIRDDMIALLVKDRVIWRDYPADIQDICGRLGEDRVDNLYKRAQEEFWTASSEAAAAVELGEVYSGGRSGGWMTVSASKPYNLADLTDPGEGEAGAVDFRQRFLRFAFERIADIEFYRGEFYASLREAGEDDLSPLGQRLKARAALLSTWHRLLTVHDDLDLNVPESSAIADITTLIADKLQEIEGERPRRHNSSSSDQ
jgi:hypothetical protein